VIKNHKHKTYIKFHQFKSIEKLASAYNWPPACKGYKNWENKNLFQ